MNAVPTKIDAIEKALMMGDFSGLNTEERLSYQKTLCDQLGINMLTKPFDWMKTKDGKLIPYANKGCAEQLRMVHNVSITITAREKIDSLYIVTAQAKLPNGREDGSTGAIDLQGLKGEMLANALMKCETKAKRRVTLSILGLNMLDETEVKDNPQLFELVQDSKPAQPKPMPQIASVKVADELPQATEPSNYEHDELLGFGKHKSEKWSEVNEHYLGWLVENTTGDKQSRALAELSRRDSLPQDDDDLPDSFNEKDINI